MPTIWTGQDTTFRLTAVNEAGDPANPTGVVFKVKDPSGTVSTYTWGQDTEVEEITLGTVYDCTFDAATSGRWVVRAELLNVDDEVVSVIEETLLVLASGVI